MDYHDLRLKVEELCREVGEFILDEKNKVSKQDIETKSLNSLVSYVDKTAEERLVKGLKQLMPEAGLITEEDTPDEKDAEYRWIIDPLDGTTNYLHGIPVFAISVALFRRDEPLVGVVYELGQKEMFSAAQGQGSSLNGQKITVNSKLLKDSLVATGFPYYDFNRMGEFLELLSRLFKDSRGVRRLGSAATDLAYVACGRFDAYFEYGLSPWDVAAGILLVKEAGGQVGDFSGGSDFLFGGEIVAASEQTYHEIQGLIDQYFK